MAWGSLAQSSSQDIGGYAQDIADLHLVIVPHHTPPPLVVTGQRRLVHLLHLVFAHVQQNGQDLLHPNDHRQLGHQEAVGKGQQGGTQDHYLQRCVLVLLGNLLAEGTIVNFDVQKTGGEKKYIRKIFLD